MTINEDKRASISYLFNTFGQCIHKLNYCLWTMHLVKRCVFICFEAPDKFYLVEEGTKFHLSRPLGSSVTAPLISL